MIEIFSISNLIFIFGRLNVVISHCAEAPENKIQIDFVYHFLLVQ